MIIECLEEKVAVIAAAARGIGQGIALRFAQEGAKLATVDILGEKLEQVADNNFVREIPLGRHGYPSDIAGAAVFFASNASNFITGCNLAAGAGQSCKISRNRCSYDFKG